MITAGDAIGSSALHEKSIYRHDSEWPLFLLARQRPQP